VGHSLRFELFNTKKNDTHELAEGKFDDEGGATVNNNLRVVTEEDLKNNHNALDEKRSEKKFSHFFKI
jgi:hypothetical protein